MKQLTAAEGRAKRDGGMENVTRGTDEAWARATAIFIRDYCRRHEKMFCDDLWAAGLPVPREARALGPIIMNAVRDGVIRRSGRVRPSIHSNMTPKPVWISLLWDGVTRPRDVMVRQPPAVKRTAAATLKKKRGVKERKR